MQVKRREARQGAHAAEWAESTTDFLRQMGYREYARYLSFHFPFTHERSLLEHVRAAPWRYDQSLFKVRCKPAKPVYAPLSAVLPAVCRTGLILPASPASPPCLLSLRSCPPSSCNPRAL